MHTSLRKIVFILSFAVLFVSACSSPPQPPEQPIQTEPAVSPTAAPTETPTPLPPRVLTVCMGAEPESLFAYVDQSVAARTIRAAIYDGPVDVRNYQLSPVILQSIPSLENGDVSLDAVPVAAGDPVINASGDLVSLAEGVRYLPAGCTDDSCAQEYAGSEAVTMDQMAVRFRLLPGLQWSDGSPLTADDSLYAFELARALYPRYRFDLLLHTLAYTALDETTVEWRGVPGYRDSQYAANFFSPLPRQAWGLLPPEELLANTNVNQTPLGWGPYVVDEWVQGDHLTLHKNELYFRSGEGLPYFDNLVFRFLPNGEEAVAALLAGECDYIDESANLETQRDTLRQLEQDGQVRLLVEPGTSWEHVDFGIQPYQAPAEEGAVAPNVPLLFAQRETRQAIAQCVDRQRLVDEIFAGFSQVPNTYLPAEHPLYNPDVRQYAFDPQAAADLLQTAGWIDLDGDPGTPRQAQGISGVPDGTPLTFTYLTTTEPEKVRAAEIVRESLAQCGIQMDIESLDWGALTAPGPEGPLFGRQFDLAQYAWVTSLEPPCFLYTSQEIPGPYPEFPKGWGGANASGYSSAEYDSACRQAMNSLPGTAAYTEGHARSQAIFAEDLPALPLYWRLRIAAARVDMCGVEVDASMQSSLSNLESFNYGESCSQ